MFKCDRAGYATLLFVLTSSSLFAADPWDGKPFSSDPKALLARAAAVEPKAKDEGVVVLLDEATFTFDASGRVVRTDRLVYRVAEQSSVEGWSSIEVPWSPWYQEKPKIEGRVVTKDGTVHMLDPKSFGTEDTEDEPDMFTDRRTVHGPLPAVAAGSVVEQLTTYREKNPLYEAGTSHRYILGRSVETHRARVVIEHPSSLTLHLVNRTSPEIKPVRSESNGVVRLVFEATALPGFADREWNLPSDVSNDSYISFSTGKSWQDVARRYSAIVDGQIGSTSLAAVTAAAVGDAKTPAEIARRILAWIQSSIRYAGVEFGEGSIIPRSPSDTLAHKYGDCKDKAVLLVAMLRHAGVPAHVALLESGSGLDIDSNLPGLGGFNHAIAVVDGPQPIWIDPTDEFARAGELPDQDQGRMALIAKSDTTTLIRTLADDASKNRTVETREFNLVEEGRSTVVETTEYHGSAERAQRRYYAETDAKTAREMLEKYATDAYLAEALGPFEIGDPRDLTKPFRVRLQALRATRGITVGGEAAVGIFAARLLQEMPWSLRDTDDEPAAESEKKTRVRDFVFTTPFVMEVEHRIRRPEGYEPRSQPQDETIRLATATMTKKYVLQPDGMVAHYRLDSGPRRITGAQYEEMRGAIKRIGEENPLLVYFDQIGRKRLDDGDVRGAVAEFRRLTVLHPREALHHFDLAKALLAGGMGAGARREAKVAIQVEPKSATAHRTLGTVLASDLIGREFRMGFDRDASIAAYRKAKDLDPKDLPIRAELAVILQRNQQGVWYGEGAKLNEAIDEYLALKKDKDFNANIDAIDRELMVLYLRTGRFAELKALTATTKDTEKKESFSLVAIAALEGAARAIKAADSIELSKRRDAQIVAAGILAAVARRYPEAGEMLNAAAQGAPNAAQLRAQVDLMRKIKRMEDYPRDPGDLQSVVRDFFLATLTGDSKTAIKRFMTQDVLDVFDADGIHDEERRHAQASAVRATLREKGVSPLFLVENALAALELHTEGTDETGYRMVARGPMAEAFGMTMFLVREGPTYRVAAISRAPEMLALRALRLVDAGKNDMARQWLDWTREIVKGGSGDDPLHSQPFAAFWTRGQQATADEIRLAAAALLPDTKKSARLALPILLRARETVSEDLRWRVDQALVSAYRAMEQWGDVLAAADRLAAKHPASETAFSIAGHALIRLGRLDEAEQRANARLQRLPGDRIALRALGDVAVGRGDHSAALEHYAKAAGASQATAGDFNAAAWAALFTKSDLSKAIEDARRAVTLAPNAHPILNTLAALYAEEGKTAEARDTLLKSLDVSDSEEPQPADWYVIGRLAEQYGVNEAAIEAYQRVTKKDETNGSAYELAQRRLALLNPQAR